MEPNTYYTGGQKITLFYKPLIIPDNVAMVHSMPDNEYVRRMLEERSDSWVNL